MNVHLMYRWESHPKAEELVLSFIEIALELNPTVSELSNDLLHLTNTRLLDWIDHIVLPDGEEVRHQLQSTGFTQQGHLFVHLNAKLPRIKLVESALFNIGIAVSVDNIASFIMTHGGGNFLIEGTPFGALRRCTFSSLNGAILWVIERRGAELIEPCYEDLEVIASYFYALENWMMRPRAFEDVLRGMEETLELARYLVEAVGQKRAAWTILEVERRYWQSKNRAGQIQKDRQDSLGMGWANHDHHTFYSSRKYFQELVEIFEVLGFTPRERVYVGKKEGWGGQVMENEALKSVVFLVVDLTEEESSQDFSHTVLHELPAIGKIDLWCSLHGESILQGGMHSLSALFASEKMQMYLKEQTITVIEVSNGSSFLKETQTLAEMWPVEERRLQQLLNSKKIDEETYKKWLHSGTFGSLLSCLERKEGYKGFDPTLR